jgi:protocatechuate 3,4-dioxygenase beta subunit
MKARLLYVPAVTALCAGALAACGASSTPQASSPASATPATTTAACRATLTSSQTEGPYFKAGSPRRTNLGTGISGRPLLITGVVRNTSCAPVAHAKLDFWQADNSGQYDNRGYRLRGYVYTDSSGRYRIQTIVPGLYPGRTRHIHVKVRAPGGPILTTQLYIPGEPRNRTDGLFNPRTVLTVTRRGASWTAKFDFAVRTA